MPDKFSPARHGDYVIFCDICGQKCWTSESKIQNVYTGRGGTLACPECQDPIDYGLVPYTIRAEKPVPISRDTMQIANLAGINQTYPTYDPAYLDPMSCTPDSWKTFADGFTTSLDWSAITTDWSNILTDWSDPIPTQAVPGGIELTEYGTLGFPEYPKNFP